MGHRKMFRQKLSYFAQRELLNMHYWKENELIVKADLS